MSAVRVWIVDLDQRAPIVTDLAALLDDAERTTAADRRTGPSRDRYVVAHGAARLILGAAVGAEPAALRIERACRHCGHAAHGRPRLADRPDTEYSLSHSDGRGVVAVGAQPVGVDIEVVRPRRSDLARLAARALSADELDRWLRLPEPDRLRGFLARWTAKEAYLKAIGLGLVRDPCSVPTDPPGWTFASLDIGAHAIGTLAVEGNAEVQVATWVPPDTLRM
ncbi:MAG: 4'-phosphopantetheinyl transferase family protein [Actinomycetota bacterium]